MIDINLDAYQHVRFLPPNISPLQYTGFRNGNDVTTYRYEYNDKENVSVIMRSVDNIEGNTPIWIDKQKQKVKSKQENKKREEKEKTLFDFGIS